ncbi:MAG: hypothetical protein C0404_06950 [Verrucomicrobia bacterium]|nr:hypothetical protein [Verrucomicrobiota bacterium]
MNRRCNFALPVFLCLYFAQAAFSLAAAPAPIPGAGAPAKAELPAEPALNAGLTWLKNNQNADGSWSDRKYPVITALCLLAVERSNHPARTNICDKAARFIASSAQKDGGIYKPAAPGRGGSALSVHNTAVCMTALHSFDRKTYQQIILKGREFIASSQVSSNSSYVGGFGYDKTAGGTLAQADLNNTAWALMAMRATQEIESSRPDGKRVDINWTAVRGFLQKMQSLDKREDSYGGFGYELEPALGRSFLTKTGSSSEHGYGTMTYAGLTAMIYAQVDRNDPRVRAALDWACRHWTLEENPGVSKGGIFCYYNIMAQSLSMFGDTITSESGKTRRWKRLLVEKLVSTQKPGGYWVNSDNQFWEGDPAVVTAYSVMALLYTLEDKPNPK